MKNSNVVFFQVHLGNNLKLNAPSSIFLRVHFKRKLIFAYVLRKNTMIEHLFFSYSRDEGGLSIRCIQITYSSKCFHSIIVRNTGIIHNIIYNKQKITRQEYYSRCWSNISEGTMNKKIHFLDDIQFRYEWISNQVFWHHYMDKRKQNIR